MRLIDSFNRMLRTGPELFSNYLVNLLCLHLHIPRFHPLITNFYVTKRCNLKCRYCYPPGDEPSLDAPAVLTLLEKIRPHSPAINFTGGEPLLYKDLPVLLKRAKELRFDPIMLSTNGLLIDRIVEHLHLIDHLIISLDSLDEELNDQLAGVRGVTQDIKENIRRCSSFAQEKGFHLSLHAVIAPETVHGMEDLLNFCESLHITLSVSPEHGRFDPHCGLRNNSEYRMLIDRLIKVKAEGRPVACSFGYLRTIRDFTPHRCYPFVSPRVEADGRVYFPCQRSKRRQVYLQDYRSLTELMQKEAEQRFFKECSARCFLACYVDVEQYIKHPLLLLKEHWIRDWVFERKKHQRRLGYWH